MLVSTKGRYALRTMVDLAVHGDGEPVKIKDIANRQGISGKYLEQIISILSRAGYVRSIRGNQLIKKSSRHFKNQEYQLCRD